MRGVVADSPNDHYIRSKDDPSNKYIHLGYDEVTGEAFISAVGGDPLEFRNGKLKNNQTENADIVVPATVTADTFSADGINFQTIFTLTALVLPDVADTAALAVGALFGTMPAGDLIYHSCKMAVSAQIDDAVDTDTPDGGVGTVIATGAVATLDGTGTFENILTGQTFNDVAGTVETKSAAPTAGVSLVVETADAHGLFFNLADTWANTTTQGMTATGTIILNWSKFA